MNSDVSIKEIFNPVIVTCPPDTPLSVAAQMMLDERASSVLVSEQGHIVGIWTEQDALKQASHDGSSDRPIRESMTSPVKTISLAATIGEATLTFRELGIRHFLVVDHGGLPLGVLSQSDIVRNQGLEYYVELRNVKSVFSRQLLLVPEDMALPDALARMREGDLSSIVVEFDDGEHGIVTERDAVRYLCSPNPEATVASLATRPLISIPLDSSLFYAKKQFVSRKIRHLGVTGERGELLGVMSFADILANIEHEYINHLREALREREESLAIVNQHLRLASKAFETTFEGIMVSNTQNVIESVNPAFTQITGYMAHEVIGKTPTLLASHKHTPAFFAEMYRGLQENGHWQGEIWNKRKNGELFVAWLNINAVKDEAGSVTHYVSIFSDITRRKAAEEQMHFLAHHDALTGLPNRSLLQQRFDSSSLLAQRGDYPLALLFIDLDHFKPINDTLGHYAGDQMLRIIAQRLTQCLHEEDTVCRLGGDEFVLLARLRPEESHQHLQELTTEIREHIAQPMLLEGHQASTTASIGISLFPEHGTQLEDLLRQADAAMYRAKEKGRNNWQLHTR